MDSHIKTAAKLALAAATLTPTVAVAEQNTTYGWNTDANIRYWYEDGIVQGTYNDPKGVMGYDPELNVFINRGREIFDHTSNSWYWLDSINNGAAAHNKEVWIPYIFQDEATPSGGKWVRYDHEGHMIKGWFSIDGRTYFYDHETGAMLKGWHWIDGRRCHFNELTGVMDYNATCDFYNYDNNAAMDSIAYIGYNIRELRNRGTLWNTHYNENMRGILSGVPYGSGCTGLETNWEGKPDIDAFRRRGLVCASYVAYVYFNYFPNVAGIDTSSFIVPQNPKSVDSWLIASRDTVNRGNARFVGFHQDGAGRLHADEPIPAGALFLLSHNGRLAHACVYAGNMNGRNFMYSLGNSKGPEMSSLEGYWQSSYKETLTYIVIPDFIR